MRKPSKLSAASLALLAQPFDWDFMSMQKASQPASQPASKRAESAPEARVVSVALHGSPTLSLPLRKLPVHLRSAQGPPSFLTTFGYNSGALLEASVRAQ